VITIPCPRTITAVVDDQLVQY